LIGQQIEERRFIHCRSNLRLHLNDLAFIQLASHQAVGTFSNFCLAHVGFGSISTKLAEAPHPLTSAIPPIPTFNTSEIRPTRGR
jgi:hypothetical protein